MSWWDTLLGKCLEAEIEDRYASGKELLAAYEGRLVDAEKERAVKEQATRVEKERIEKERRAKEQAARAERERIEKERKIEAERQAYSENNRISEEWKAFLSKPNPFINKKEQPNTDVAEKWKAFLSKHNPFIE
ncbi:hypothetical protein FACS1894187_25250 [Synergistales bacterium]|nr:hypothetical protein FACS1894187_25250 [Synergistales bacterium]